MADELRPPASAQEEIERKEMFLTWLWKEEKEEADAAAAAASETGSEAPERWYQPYTEYIPKDKKRQLKGFWENYDKDLSLGPQLVSKAEWEASKKIRVRVRLWIASRRHNARVMKKEYEIKNREAANVQKVYRGYQGRMLAKLNKQEAAKKETLMRDYQEWQEMLMKSSIKGPKVEKYDHAKGTFFVTQLSISGDRKFLSFKGPGMLGGAEKVKVNNIFAIERNPSPKMRKVRGGKKGDPNLHLCLRHKDFTNPDAKEMAVDLQVHTPGKVASTERNRWYQSFLQLQDELDGPDAFYFDEKGNFCRVGKSVFDRWEVIELLVPNPKGDGGGEGGGERSDSFMGGAFGDDDGPGFKGFAEADKEADFKTKYHNDGGRAVEMYDGHKAQLNMDPYYISRIKRHTYTLCEQDEKGGPKMQNPAPKGPDGVPVDKPERISIDGDGKFKKAMEKRERERTGNLGVRGWRFKSAKGDEKYEFDEDMWEKLKELGLATKKSSKDKDDKDEKDEEAKDDGGKALEDAQMADEELAEVQQNDAGSGAGAGAGDDKPPEKPADDDDEADDDKPEWELCIEEWGKSKKKLEENEEEYPQPGKGYRLIGKAYNRAQKWAIDQEKNRLRKEAERRIEAEKEAKRKKDAEVSAATNPSAADEGAGEEKEDENPVAVPLAPSGTGLLVPTPSGRRFKELQELDKADETRFIMYEVCLIETRSGRQRWPPGLIFSHVENKDLPTHTGVDAMVYKKGLVASKFTCGLLVGGLCPGAPPSIARAYQNGVIRVDDLLVAVNGTPSGKMKPDPKWKPSTDDANTSEKVPLELAYPKDAAVTADALEAAVKDDRRPRDLTFIRVIKPEAEESDEED